MERCPKTQRLHWQGYIELKDRMRVEQLKRDVFHDNTVHIEMRKKSQREAINYCRKPCAERPLKDGEGGRVDGTEVVTFGEPREISCKGYRSDLADFMEDAKSGCSLKQLYEDHPDVCAKANAFANRYKAMVEKEQIPIWRPVKVIVYWGHTGMGKTRRCFHEGVFRVCSPGEDKKLWFDGYEGEKFLLLDDFDGWIPITQLLVLIDGYRVRTNVKGSHCWAAWNTVYITSNISPDEWYPQIAIGHRNALIRRLDEVHHVITEWVPDAQGLAQG